MIDHSNAEKMTEGVMKEEIASGEKMIEETTKEG